MEEVPLSPIEDVRSYSLLAPSLSSLTQPLALSLKSNYTKVSVRVEECPDLRKFGLSRAGLNSSSSESQILVQMGNEENVLKSEGHSMMYSIKQAGVEAGLKDGYALGAAVLPPLKTGFMGEYMVIQDLKDTDKRNSHFAKVQGKEAKIGKYKSDVFGMFATVYISEGLPGEVLKIEVEGRHGDEANFINAIRAGLKQVPGVGENKQIGLGGIFMVESGKIQAHIPGEFNEKIFEDYEDIDDWLTKFEMGPGLVGLTVLLSDDPTPEEYLVKLRQHCHFYSLDGKEGGHYRKDITPEEIKYVGYFALTGKVVDINNPQILKK